MRWWPFGSSEETSQPERTVEPTRQPSEQPGVRKCWLNASCDTKVEVYRAIYQQLEAEDWTGENLDALYDFLTGMVAGPFEIEWRDIKQAEEKLGGDWTRIINMLRDVALERADFKLILTSAV
jgi:ribonuclease inhibitor